ncbi:hypothetical protein HUG10_16195 [Halorarum halophilum]|uniref:Secreted glycoprotein n=1 Tax=Halorarum halophilum TaxID=2743090 RepID=A0A7D5K2P1_9EURY|nr:hypothetical protein [Halobaculum halophilum]QLG28981.1 hypothetical protein HUG10_16195 [Halobaculum halophilum]
MRSQSPQALVAILVAVGVVVVGLGAATERSQQTAEDSPLDDNETATLWSKDSDRCTVDPNGSVGSKSEQHAMEELANCTDITFKRPPATAATWSAHDFGNLEPGDGETSVHPPDANLTESVAIADAHASLFAVHPSTRIHRDPGTSPLYIAPHGTVRGLVDYRVRVPEDGPTETGSGGWSVVDHEVSEVRLYFGDDRLAVTDGSQLPVIEYRTNGSRRTTLKVEADIRVTLSGQMTEGLGNGSEMTTDHLTVSDSVPVRVYDPVVEQYRVGYPNGDAGVAIYQSQPWHGYQLTADGEARVRGIWRYYTARDESWDELVHARVDGSERTDSDARPVYVHAYPSEIGPRAEPVRDGPTILDVWGTESQSPASRLHENVSVDVVTSSYTRSYGLGLRYTDVDPDQLRVHGVVRGVNATIRTPDGNAERPLHESNLSIDVLEQNESTATLRIELSDATTGVPIHLAETQSDDPQAVPIGGEAREGYITVNGQRIETNVEGVAVVTVNEPGSYTARYHPGSWLSHDPAYVGDSASLSWHPLWTISGWTALIAEVVWWSIPFITALYGGIRLGRFLQYDEYL